ncbi:hypothetical protein H696_03485 [Fonticula alba]|uniref:Endoplasmic reticulum protein n=1 Tax=Fonticula alba TaxID=691883 RepID=A0A058Z7Z8_FONAL|nr:hypothetical protein H696_03485 [Fonticula alba]KCV70018.1 hypothetical protein H696_03485 [Fonticula alba]|eukprot:XP_009495624.1 hypothetical protein H696_03485 [Fonticula alba]
MSSPKGKTAATAATKPSIFNFKEQVARYGEYHSNRVNQIIHMIFVPVILWTAFVWLTAVGPFATLPKVSPWAQPTAAVIAGTLFNLYYIALEPMTGLLYIPQMCLLLYSAYVFAHSPSVAHPHWVAFGVHVVSWIAQFWGHGKHEGRKPALLDNLFQSLVMAPLFVFLETLFLVGYRPQLHRLVRNESGKRRAAWLRSLKKAH